jgi:AAA+ ATPase superfamily predicted ATPase
VGERGRFVGRERELAVLRQEAELVRAEGAGRLVVIKGRRQIGKSRFVEVFLERTGLPHVFFAATKGRSPQLQLRAFAEELARSSLPAGELARGGLVFDRWEAALETAALGSERGSVAVVVLDELPYLMEQDPSFDGMLQTLWDRRLRRLPILLILVGSDLAMMDLLSSYGRPLYGRVSREITLPPLSPAEVADLAGLDAADAFDACLVVGGFPFLVLAWGRARDVGAFVRREVPDPTSPLVVLGERMLAAEFPPDAHARLVLTAIGAGERTFTGIAGASGLPKVTLQRSLELLMVKRVVERETPLSARPSRLARYTVSDPYLRFWLRYILPGLEEILRGRGDHVVRRILETWPDYRGRAVEPLVRRSLERMLPQPRFGGARYVGAYWTRSGEVELDLVGAAKMPLPTEIAFVGSIKWRDRAAFDHGDLARLIEQRPRVPGAGPRTRLVGVSRTGFRVRGELVQLGPAELLDAWRGSEPG